MARYIGNYIDDLGNSNLNFPIYIYIINSNNKREFTDNREDREYLPESYFQDLSDLDLAFCRNPGIRRARQFIFSLDNGLELFAEIPYLPASQQFINLANELKERSTPFKYWGESLKDYYIEYNFGKSI